MPYIELFIGLTDYNLKLAECMGVQWIGSESVAVIPLKELCLREIGMFEFSVYAKT